MNNQIGPLTRTGMAYEKLNLLFDEGTFVELGAYLSDKAYANVVCGYGAVDGALTFAFAQDFDRNKGALGVMESRKICDLYEQAKKCGAPVVGVFASAGAKIEEGAAALAAFGTMMKKISEISGVVPQIAVIDGVCAGLSATAASMFDLVIASKSASYYICPPNVQKNAGIADAGTVATAAKNGVIDVVCPDSDTAIAKARALVAMIPQNNRQGLAYIEAGDDLCRATPEVASAKDAKALLNAVCDNGTYTLLKETCAPEVAVALASLGSMTAGIIANDAGAALTPKAARKIAQFITFCDNFSIPVVTLVNTTGIDATVDAEAAPDAPEYARLATAYAGATCAKVTAVVGKAYGAAFTLLGSRSVGADVALALSTAEISVMEPDAAVQFLYGDEIKASADPVALRAEKKKAWLTDVASAEAAARAGEVDDVIAPEELRARIISACMMLWSKAEGDIRRKHSKLPF
ncbi:MAG: carboxyl transferase domain-containing protein [Eubacteriales bacterium]